MRSQRLNTARVYFLFLSQCSVVGHLWDGGLQAGTQELGGHRRGEERGEIVQWALWPHITSSSDLLARTQSHGPNRGARESGKPGLPCVSVCDAFF